MSETLDPAVEPALGVPQPAVVRPHRVWARWIALALAALFGLSLLWPDEPMIPVQGATRADWHPRSFWYHPWGASGVHKGIDIFAPEGLPILAATSGLVVRSGMYGAAAT